MQEIGCAQIWGGVRGKDADVQGSGFIASVYSRAAEGAKGGDIYYLSVCSGEAITRIALADVRGHGDSVSETSQWLYEALQIRVNELDGSDLLTDLNALVGQRGYEAMTARGDRFLPPGRVEPPLRLRRASPDVRLQAG